MSESFQHEVLVIGSGSAGLSAALILANKYSVALIGKDNLHESATYYAQGGIAAVIDQNDSAESHIEDTLIAGAGLCNEAVVRHTVTAAKASIEWLISQGMVFTKNENNHGFHLSQEGGHSHRRVLHHDDATGKALESTLIDQVLTHQQIQVFADHTAIDLILSSDQKRCLGAYLLNNQTGKIDTFGAQHIILATGGASKVYLYTTSPHVSSGDGIAMAWRAGCAIANMEFNQFHPTCLYHEKANSFLLSEVIRGEGGHLCLPDGSRFMDKFDARAELAPRDIVARSIDFEMKRLGVTHLYLDISHQPKAFIQKRFPTIYERCLQLGIDMSREPMPIVPAAHYTCGGILTNIHAQTDIPNLYAIGETACTGLHGANRMASNSLLECIVFAKAAAEHILSQPTQPVSSEVIPLWDESLVRTADECVTISHSWDELRRFMWDYVGIVRTTQRLKKAKKRIQLLNQEIHDYYSRFKVNKNLIELRNLATVASIIIDSALMRKESRGLHYILDYPEKLPIGKDTVLSKT